VLIITRRAEEIIRKVVQNKESILDAIGSYTCNVYVKAFQLDSGFTKKKKDEFEDEPVPIGENKDFSNMAMTEVSLHVDKNANGQLKEERLGVKRRGSSSSLFYLSATEGDFYLYNI